MKSSIFAATLLVVLASVSQANEENVDYPNCQVSVKRGVDKALTKGINRNTLCQESIYALTGRWGCELRRQYELYVLATDQEMYSVGLELKLEDMKNDRFLYDNEAVLHWYPGDSYVQLGEPSDLPGGPGRYCQD